MTSINERFTRLDAFIREGRLVRNMWGDGQERACLLLALAPEVGAQGEVDRCPASLIPEWLAHLTPAVDDCGTQAAWPAMVRRYSAVVRRGAETLDDAGWRRVQARFLLAVLGEAPSPEGEAVAALWRRVLAGDEPSGEEWSAAACAAAWDRMTTALLDAIEIECGDHHREDECPYCGARNEPNGCADCAAEAYERGSELQPEEP